jgi:hypothetical protein
MKLKYPAYQIVIIIVVIIVVIRVFYTIRDLTPQTP